MTILKFPSQRVLILNEYMNCEYWISNCSFTTPERRFKYSNRNSIYKYGNSYLKLKLVARIFLDYKQWRIFLKRLFEVILYIIYYKKYFLTSPRATSFLIPFLRTFFRIKQFSALITSQREKTVCCDTRFDRQLLS